jgi:ADP-ribose pyrophosphatase YjhB (NUDIX family)
MERGPTMTDDAAGSTEPLWLLWAREMQALAQTGLAFSRDQYDRDRYQQLQALAARIMAEHGGLDVRDLELLFSRQTGYATPKCGVRGAVFRDEKILLVREIADEHRWSLPGGWADVNEAPAEAVSREVREEAGLEVRACKLAAVWDRTRHPHTRSHPFQVWRLFFLCEIAGGELQTGPETSEVAFFAEHELPADLSTSRILLPQIRRMFEHMREPSLATDFD